MDFRSILHSAQIAREQLVNLLISTNRYEEALIEYKRNHLGTQDGQSVDFKLLELLLRTGRYNDVLEATIPSPNRPYTILYET